MPDSETLSWSKLPRFIIKIICANLTRLDLLESRLINKHWSNVTNSLTFSEIYHASNKEQIIRKYGKWISNISNHSFSKDLLDLIANNCKNLKSITWVLPKDIDTLLKILNSCNNISYFSLSYYQPGEEIDNVKLDLVLDTILSLKSLRQVNLEPYGSVLLDFFLKLPQNNLNTLNLNSNDYFKNDIILKLKGLSNLKTINWNIRYPNRPNEVINSSEFLSPYDLIDCANLDHVTVRVYKYNSQVPMENYLVDTFINLFNNSNFKNLKSLEWHINRLRVDYLNLFPHELPQSASKFTNLKLINLMIMDKYLLSYIIEMCPMLEDLRFISPLILPHKVHKLSSLNRLKKLLCVGFEEDIEDSSDQIRRIFPNVHVVNMHYTTDRFEESIMQVSAIPKLFPKANSVILAAYEYNLTRLIDNINSGDVKCEWQTLYIVLHSYNKKFLDPLLESLNNLKQLFIYAYSEYSYPEVINHPVVAYKAGHLDYSAYTFNIVEKI